MGRADRDKRYRRWDECLLDLMLVQKGNPPFSAHLADAQDPESRTGTPTPGPLAAAASAGSPACDSSTRSRGRVAAVPPGLLTPIAAGPLDIPPAPVTPRSDRFAAFLGGAMIAGVLGVAVAWYLRPDPIADMRAKARALAATGREDDAVKSLRSAALLAPPEVAARLHWEADAIEKK